MVVHLFAMLKLPFLMLTMGEDDLKLNFHYKKKAFSKGIYLKEKKK